MSDFFSLALLILMFKGNPVLKESIGNFSTQSSENYVKGLIINVGFFDFW